MLALAIFLLCLSIIILLQFKVEAKFGYLLGIDTSIFYINIYVFFGFLKIEIIIPVPVLGYKNTSQNRIIRIGRIERVLERKKNNSTGQEFMKVLKKYFFKNLNDVTEPYSKSTKWLLGFPKIKISVDEFYVNISGGLIDAYYTGIFTGFLYALVGFADTFLTNIFKIKKRNINIRPDFSKKTYEADVYCILTIKNVNIIMMTVKLLFMYVYQKITKGGDRIGTSDRRTYDNSYGKH